MPSVSEPATLAEAAALFEQAARAGARVSIGTPRSRPPGDIVLSMRRLDRILEHEAGDLTCIAEAGVRLSALNERLAEPGQMLALDPPGDPTVGACIAGNLSGPRRHRYGTARDLVLGVTVVLPDGTVASAGGKVVKNVAGYDLGKLLCGSRGTLGLIVRAALRLHPRPAAARTLVVPVEGPGEARRLARAALHSTLPSALDLLWGAGPARLALLFEGSARAVDVQLEQARGLFGGAEDDGSVWLEVAERQAASLGRLSFPPGELAQTLERVPEAIVRIEAGVAYVPDAAAQPADEALRRLTERVRVEFDPRGILV